MVSSVEHRQGSSQGAKRVSRALLFCEGAGDASAQVVYPRPCNHMAKPTYLDPVAPTLESPLYDPAYASSNCGATYRLDVEIRYPYEGTDIFVRELPRVWNKVLDISMAFPDLEQRIEDVIAQTSSDLDAYTTSADVSESNYDTIDEILDLAAEYLDYCERLREYWADQSLEYVESEGIEERDARGWLSLPLTATEPITMQPCVGKTSGFVARLELANDAWVDFRCPANVLAETYAEDWSRYKETLAKAAKQARCAQEALYSLVAYSVNQRNAPSATEPMGPPKPAEPGETLKLPRRGPSIPDTPETSQVPPELPAPVEPGWSTRKKVVVAAAGIGVLSVAAYMLTRGSGLLVERNPRPAPPAHPPRTRPHRDAVSWAP